MTGTVIATRPCDRPASSPGPARRSVVTTLLASIGPPARRPTTAATSPVADSGRCSAGRASTRTSPGPMIAPEGISRAATTVVSPVPVVPAGRMAARATTTASPASRAVTHRRARARRDRCSREPGRTRRRRGTGRDDSPVDPRGLRPGPGARLIRAGRTAARSRQGCAGTHTWPRHRPRGRGADRWRPGARP